MKPEVKEFKDDVELMQEVKEQSKRGISKEDLYVMSHDDDRTERVANKMSANKLGEGLESSVGKVFNKKGDELRAELKGLGFTQEEASEYENKLDHGSILLINTESKS